MLFQKNKAPFSYLLTCHSGLIVAALLPVLIQWKGAPQKVQEVKAFIFPEG